MKDEIDLARVWSRSDHPPGVSNHDWISSCRFSDSASVNNSDRVHLRYSRTWLFTDGWTGPTGLLHSSYLQGHGKWQTGNAKATAGTVSLRIHLPSSGIQPSATINTGLQQQHRGPSKYRRHHIGSDRRSCKRTDQHRYSGPTRHSRPKSIEKIHEKSQLPPPMLPTF